MTSYAELAEVLDALPMLCREKRRRQALSLRAAAREMDVNFSVLQRFENGDGIHLSNARLILLWLDAKS